MVNAVSKGHGGGVARSAVGIAMFVNPERDDQSRKPIRSPLTQHCENSYSQRLLAEPRNYLKIALSGYETKPNAKAEYPNNEKLMKQLKTSELDQVGNHKILRERHTLLTIDLQTVNAPNEITIFEFPLLVHHFPGKFLTICDVEI